MAVHIDDDICIRMRREIREKFFFLLFFHSSDLSKKEKKNYSVSIDSKFEISVQRGKLIWTVQPGIWTLDRCIN